MKNILPKESGLAVLPILLIGTLVIAAGAVGAYVASNNPKLFQQVSKTEENTTNPAENITSPDSGASNESASLNSTDMKNWEKLGIDSTWNLYRMTYLGFEVRIPRQMYNQQYGCFYNTAEGDHSYRPEGSMDDVLLLTTEKSAIFVNNSYTKLTKEFVGEDGVHYYGGCDRVVVGLENVGDYGTQHWRFLTESVKNDAELLEFVQTNYGSGCEISKKASPIQAGTFDVHIESGGMEDEGCPINYMYTIKYSPSKNKAVSWTLGQACTFAATPDYVCYDNEANSSFRFLD